MLVVCSLMLGYEINAQRPADVINITTQSMFNYDEFSFLVFCPYSYYNKIESFERQQNGELWRRLQERKTYNYELEVTGDGFDANSTYVVEAQSHSFTFLNTTSDKNVSINELFYCGLVRNYTATC